MGAKKKRKKKPIKTLADIRREKDKLRVALEYSEKSIAEDWEEVTESVKPKNLTQVINNVLPYIGKALPVSKLAFRLIPGLFSRKSAATGKEESPDEEKDQQEAGEDAKPSLGKRFKRTMVRTMVPFFAGTAASAALLFRATRKKKPSGE